MATYNIQVRLDPSNVKAGAQQVKQQLEGVSAAADRTRNLIAGTFAGIGVGVLVKGLTDLAETYTRIQNRLRTVTTGSAELSLVTEKLFNVAQRSRASFEATAELYARLATNAKQLGVTQNQLIQFTETLNKAIILSGATAQEASNALIQLSQGMSSGALRGDELRSVLEQLPVVADIIAKGMGVTRGELRALGAEGKITAEIILSAFKQAEKSVEEGFAKTIPTLSQAMQVAQNNMAKFVGEADASLGVTRALGQVIIFLSDNLNVLAGVLGVVALVIASRLTVAMIGMANVALASVVPSLKAMAASLAFVNVTAGKGAAAMFLFGRAASVAGSLAASAISLVGGPIGILVIALGVVTAGFLSFQGAVERATAAIDTMNKTAERSKTVIENVGERIAEINGIKIFGDLPDDAKAAEVALGDTRSEVDGLSGALLGLARARKVAQLDELTQELERVQAERAALIKQTQSDLSNSGGQQIVDFVTGGNQTQQVMDNAVVALQGYRGTLDDLQNRINTLTGAPLTAFVNELDKGANILSGGEEAVKSSEKAIKSLSDELAALRTPAGLAREQLTALLAAGLDPAKDGATETAARIKDLVAQVYRLNAAEEAAEEASKARKAQAEAIQKLKDQVTLLNIAVGDERDIAEELIAQGLDPLTQRYSEQGLVIAGLIIQKNTLQKAEDAATAAAKEAADAEERRVKALSDVANARAALVAGTIRDLDQERMALGLTEEQRVSALAIMQIEKQMRDNLRQSNLGLTEQEIESQGRLSEAEREKITQDIQGNEILRQKLELQNANINAVNAAVEAATRYTDSTVFYIENEQRLYDRVAELRAKGVLDEQQAQNAIQKIREETQKQQLNKADQFFGTLAELQKSGNSKIAAIGKAAAVAQALVNTYQAANAAYAAMAGIPYVGPALGAAAAAAAVVAGLANVAQIRSTPTGGYMNGGWVEGAGGSRTDSILAGNKKLSNGEFVVNAAAAKANAGTLERINRGDSVGDGGMRVTNNWHIQTPDADSFNASKGQMDARSEGRLRRANSRR